MLKGNGAEIVFDNQRNEISYGLKIITPLNDTLFYEGETLKVDTLENIGTYTSEFLSFDWPYIKILIN